MNFFTRVHPRISVPTFYLTITAGLFVRYVLGTITGSFILLMCFYFYLKAYGQTKPLSFQELVMWVDGLEKEYKTAIFSALLTVIGFVVAFYTATLNWKSQMKAELKFLVAGEIEDFFANISKDITSALLYAELLKKTISEIKSGDSSENLHFHVQYVQQQNANFLAVRQRLSSASVEVHRLVGKNYNILATGWELIRNLQEATNSFTEITRTMWIHVPIVNIEDVDCITNFVTQVDESECDAFIDVCNRNYSKINFFSGSVRGYLISPVVGINLFSFLNMFSIRTEFTKMMKELYQQRNTKNS